MNERRWLLSLLGCMLLALAVWQFLPAQQEAVAQVAPAEGLMSEFADQSCVVHLRRDVLAGAVEIPLPNTVNELGRDQLSIRGDFVSMTSDWVVIKSKQAQPLAVPREAVLFVEFSR